MKKEKKWKYPMHEGDMKSSLFPKADWYKPKIINKDGFWQIEVINKGRARKLKKDY